MMTSKTLLSGFFLLLTLTLCLPSASAQPGPTGPPGGRGPSRMMGRGGGGLGRLLRNPAIQEEIELQEGQKKELQELEEVMRNQMREMFQGMRDASPEERQEKRKELQQKMQDFRSSTEKKISGVLLPNQVTRLKQIAFQQQTRSFRGGRGDASILAQKLGLSEEQQKKFREHVQKVQKNLREKVRKLELEARNELLEGLTSEQRAKLKELTGKEFKMPERDQQRGRRGRPGDQRTPNRGSGSVSSQS